jgi:hypothetical protein
MVVRGRGAFEWMVALVDEDSLKVLGSCAGCSTWCINRQLLLLFCEPVCAKKTEPEFRLRLIFC